MESKYIEGVEVPKFDERVSEFLDEYSHDGGGTDMRIDIQNYEGQTYRVILTTGLGEFMHAVEFLGSLGMKDELKDTAHGERGVDCRFVPTEEMRVDDLTSVARSGQQSPIQDLQSEEESLRELDETTREAVVASRIGQGRYRTALIEYWGGCAVTGADFTPMLRASHIKPWRSSSNEERLDMYNGLLLAPHLDAAFDQGLISFDDGGQVVVSPVFNAESAYSFRITPKLKLNKKKLTDKHREYLRYHREQVLLK